jgi:hypothetical protein
MNERISNSASVTILRELINLVSNDSFSIVPVDVMLPVFPDFRPQQTETEIANHAIENNHQEDFKLPMGSVVQ